MTAVLSDVPLHAGICKRFEEAWRKQAPHPGLPQAHPRADSQELTSDAQIGFPVGRVFSLGLRGQEWVPA